MTDEYDILRVKVVAIMSDWRPDRAAELRAGVFGAMGKVTEALADDHQPETASAIAFRLSDWNWDAAFLVTVHLYPERFTSEKIRTGVGMLLTHAANHLAYAARLAGRPVEDIFSEAGDGELPSR